MIVVDASALVDWLSGVPRRADAVGEHFLAAGSVHTLELATLEVMSAIRRHVQRGLMDAERASVALTSFAEAPFVRHGIELLAARVWALRELVGTYDAAYIALAEALAAPLVTTDARLGRSHGHIAVVVSVGGRMGK